MDYKLRIQYLTFDQDILDVVDLVQKEHEKKTLEGRLLKENIPLKAQEFYCKYTGRHNTLQQSTIIFLCNYIGNYIYNLQRSRRKEK
jgi:hypothetical protein